MNTIQLTINGTPVACAPNSTILEAAQSAGFNIPTLCFLKDCNKVAACRMCVVEIQGARTLMPACATKVRDGMVVETESNAVQDSRRRTLDLIFRHHNTRCEYCSRYSDCELHALLRQMGMNEHLYETGERTVVDDSTRAIVRDNSKCVTCRRCVSMCGKVQGIGVLKALRSAGQTIISTESSLAESECIQCGACVSACPTGALSIYSEVEKVAFALRNKRGRRVVALVAPAVTQRVGEPFYDGKAAGYAGKLITLLRMMGFDAVYDRRAFEGSSVCPAVYRYVESRYPELSNGLSPGKDACWSKARTAASERFQIPEEEIFLVSMTACTAEKGEDNPVDATLTTVEVVDFIRHMCVSRFTANEMWAQSQETQYDMPAEALPVSTKRQITGMQAVQEYLEAVRMGMGSMAEVALYACPGGCLQGGGQPRTTMNGIPRC